MNRTFMLSILSLLFALLAIGMVILGASAYTWLTIVLVALAGACLGAAVTLLRKGDSNRK